MPIILYGIPNCGTVKKARAWLDAKDVAYTFHDYKKAGISDEKLTAWCKVAGWEALLNRAGTTFKKLPDTSKSELDQAKAIRLMLGQPSMIRRPVVEHGAGLLVGFDEPQWQATLRG
ncbi:MAG: arsenate reductase [Hyphomicrobiaceae bacterium]